MKYIITILCLLNLALASDIVKIKSTPDGIQIGTLDKNTAEFSMIDSANGMAKIQFVGWIPLDIALKYASMNLQEQKPEKHSTKTQTSSVRCQAKTKKGSQCKRMAKPGSNYCWQHGG